MTSCSSAAVEHGARDRAGLVEGARHGDEAVAGDRAVGRLDADGAGDGGGLADRAARVRADRQRRLVGGDGRRGAAAGAAGDPLEVPRVARVAVRRVLGGRAHRELVHVGLAEDRQPGGLDPLDERRVVRRHPALEDLRAGRGRLALGHDDVLDGDRHAGQRVQLLARGAAGVDVGRGGERLVGVDVQERVHGAVDGGDAVQVGLRDLDAGHLAGRQQRPASAAALRRVRSLMRPPRGSAGRGTCRPAPPGRRRARRRGRRRDGHVGAEHVRQRQGVGGGRHVRRGDLAHARDRLDDHVELAGEPVELGGRQVDPGQPRDARDLVAGEGGHGPESSGVLATTRSTAGRDEREQRLRVGVLGGLGREQLLRPARHLDEDLVRAVVERRERAERAAELGRAAGPRAAATARRPAPTESSAHSVVPLKPSTVPVA